MFCRNPRKCNGKEVGAWSSQRKMEGTNGWEWSPSCISALSVNSQKAELCGLISSDFSLPQNEEAEVTPSEEAEISAETCQR